LAPIVHIAIDVDELEKAKAFAEKGFGFAVERGPTPSATSLMAGGKESPGSKLRTNAGGGRQLEKSYDLLAAREYESLPHLSLSFLTHDGKRLLNQVKE